MGHFKDALKKWCSLDFASRDAKKTLLGSSLVKIGSGGLFLWGQISLYIYSYYFQFEQAFSVSTEMILFYVGLVPMIACTVASVRTAEKVGYALLIRVCVCVYPVCVVLSGLVQRDVNVFILLYLTVPLMALALYQMPILCCLWSHFPQQTGKVSGIAFFFQSIAGSLYSVLSLYIMNPENKRATVELQTSASSHLLLFDESVARNLHKTLIVLGISYAVFVIPGGFMVSHANDARASDSTPAPRSNDIELEEPTEKSQEKERVISAQTYSSSSPSSLQQAGGGNRDTHAQQYAHAQQESPSRDDINTSKAGTQVEMTVPAALRTPTFVVFFCTTALLALNSVFLSTHLKTYGVTKINDDEFLTYVGSVSNIVSAFSTLFLGPLVDVLNVKSLYMWTVVVYSATTITLPWATTHKPTFLVWNMVISIINSWVMTMAGPILVKYFGIDLAQKLMPIKGMSIFVAIFLMPVCLVFALRVATFDAVFVVLGVMSLLSAFAVKFKMAEVRE